MERAIAPWGLRNTDVIDPDVTVCSFGHRHLDEQRVRGGRGSFVRIGMSALDQQGGFGPEALAIASAAFAKSWRFIESDPVLEGNDHALMQAELARAIVESLKMGERDEIRIANGAIRRTRDRMLKPEKHSAL